MEIIEERYITKYEALETIKSISAQSPILQNTLENIRYSLKKEIDIKKLEDLKKEIKNLGLKESEIVMILDFLPESIEDLNVLFGKNIKFFDEEKQKKIIDIIKNVI